MICCLCVVLLCLALKSIAPTVTRVIRSQRKGGVSAVTSLGDDVFVMRFDSQQIEVYDAQNFKPQGHITVPGLCEVSVGLAACAHYKCLYVSNCDWDSVHRIELMGDSAVKNWSVASLPTGLSINNAHNLVVACSEANKIQEYTTHGTLVREICPPAGVTNPRHAVQLSTGDYVVSQRESPGTVSIIGVDGQVVQSSDVWDFWQLNNPTCLAVNSNDDILVVDKDSNRILSMNSSLSSIQQLDISVCGGVQSLSLDESRGRLYVGENEGRCRVLVFDCVRL